MSAESSVRSAVLGVIPARLGSERLPRKPLQLLEGRPLIEWVWRRARTFSVLDALVVATDSDEVASVCQGIGADVVLTAPDHPSGTERAAEVAERPEFARYEVVVNVQGDEPFVTEEQVGAAAALVLEGWDIGTVAAPVATAEAWADPSVVKVVRGDDGGALYFSRAPIPHVRSGAPTPTQLASHGYLRHIGVYAYSRNALGRWAALPASDLERAERLEQLRPLAAGLSIGVAVVTAWEGGVDTPEDLERAARRLRLEAHYTTHDNRTA